MAEKNTAQTDRQTLRK